MVTLNTLGTKQKEEVESGVMIVSREGHSLISEIFKHGAPPEMARRELFNAIYVTPRNMKKKALCIFNAVCDTPSKDYDVRISIAESYDENVENYCTEYELCTIPVKDVEFCVPRSDMDNMDLEMLFDPIAWLDRPNIGGHRTVTRYKGVRLGTYPGGYVLRRFDENGAVYAEDEYNKTIKLLGSLVLSNERAPIDDIVLKFRPPLISGCRYGNYKMRAYDDEPTLEYHSTIDIGGRTHGPGGPTCDFRLFGLNVEIRE
jgi:hypothetical protein